MMTVACGDAVASQTDVAGSTPTDAAVDGFPDVILDSAPARAIGVLPETPGASPIAPPRYGLARTATVERVAAIQSVEVPLGQLGSPMPSGTPLLIGRDLRLRLRVAGGDGQLLLARVRWTAAGEETLFARAVHLPEEPNDAEERTVSFEVPGALVTADAQYRVELLEDEGLSFDEGASSARYPMSGETAPLGAVVPAPLQVRLVPMAFQHDGSGRLPLLDGENLAALEVQFEAVFPIRDAVISVAPARTYDGPLSPLDFSEHSTALHTVLGWRAEEGVADDVYYVGLVTPQESFRTYCAEGCYTGIAPLNESNASFQRAGLVVWYGVGTSGWTTLHELGHAHGRAHAPCGGAAGEDPDFPQVDGTTGVLGLDQRTGELQPTAAHDFMSYCGNRWISAYTYQALAERSFSIRALATASSVPLPKKVHWVITVSEEGEGVRWTQLSLPIARASEGPVAAWAIDRHGQRHATWARAMTYSAEGGHSWLVEAGADVVAYEVDGTRFDVPAP